MYSKANKYDSPKVLKSIMSVSFREKISKTDVC